MSPKSKVAAFGVVSAVLIVAVTAVVGFWQFTQMNRMHAGRLLAAADALLVQIVNERVRHIETVSTSMATNPGFVGYIATALNTDANPGQTVDISSIRDLLEERRREVGLAAAAALDANGKTIVATGDSFLSSYDYSVLALVKQAKTAAVPATSIISDGSHLHLVTITPMTRSGVDALLLTAELMDETSLRTIAGISKAELAFVVFPGDGPHVLSTTLEAAETQALAEAANEHKAAWLAHAGARDPNQDPLVLAGRTWATEIFPVPRTDRNTVLVALVAPSYADALAAALLPPLALTAALAILAMAVLLFVLWRGTLGPVTTITGLAERAQRGDYALTFKAPGSGIAFRLAQAMNQILLQLDRHRVPPGTPRRRATDTR